MKGNQRRMKNTVTSLSEKVFIFVDFRRVCGGLEGGREEGFIFRAMEVGWYEWVQAGGLVYVL